MRKLFLFFALIAVASAWCVGSARAQETKKAPESSSDKVKVEDTKPARFDMFFKVREEKLDTNGVKAVIQSFIARLNSASLAQGRDYQIYVGHDTLQVRILNNKRDVTEWVSLLARQGILRIHLANDSLYFASVDTAHVPTGYIVLPEPDGKTRHYVQDRILNGKLVQMANTIEQFDNPTLNGIIVPTDTNYKSFLFTKGMRFAVVVDGVIWTTALVSSDSAAINQFPLMTQYPAALTFIIDRVVRYPLPTAFPVDFLGWRKAEEK